MLVYDALTEGAIRTKPGLIERASGRRDVGVLGRARFGEQPSQVWAYYVLGRSVGTSREGGGDEYAITTERSTTEGGTGRPAGPVGAGADSLLSYRAGDHSAEWINVVSFVTLGASFRVLHCSPERRVGSAICC